ncbi:Nicotianamine synthase [Dothidotthia symphoricarpi CBS 119687]|uniref:Nicotianamine synthase n=1 Tax=Dothidotthia symphoricarpi CBS 119687 TaxID=1392245 RepID=A0A6A6A090_9PLEO|nr:Nicotianamine synthase [Dothidotthia symphoricarpi CBS 119687]KAF2124564.1 Nicotianamine synthase [Dothidotthia symphoricarpi CBS 119687]
MTTPWTQTAGVVKSNTVHVATDSPPTTPSAISTSAHQLVFQLRNILEKLSALETLVPGKEVNELLTGLVTLCITPYPSELTAYFLNIDGVQSLCEQLRPLCATAEGELERYWAHRIFQDASSARVHNVDRDIEALQVSQGLCEKLGYEDRMSFSCEDVSMDSGQATSGLYETDWKSFDAIFLAALVGLDTNAKLGILESLSKKLEPGTLVVARSARGLRSVLYPVLELSQDLQRIGFEVLAEVHPWTKVVNSVIVLRVMEVCDMD